jgi:hypothetical protein
MALGPLQISFNAPVNARSSSWDSSTVAESPDLLMTSMPHDADLLGGHCRTLAQPRFPASFVDSAREAEAG